MGFKTVLGTTGLFVFDKNGVVTVDKTKANMWLGLDGYIHTKGDIYAKNLYFLDGTDVKTLLSEKTKKIDSTLLDLGNIQLDGVTGDITLTGNINLSNGNINWGNNTPNKQRYAASTAGPWHDSMQSGDIYCCDWNYTTNVWGAPYKKVGTDGAPGQDGSDATVPRYITDTIIGKGIIEAPQINANNFGIYPPDSTVEGGAFNLYGNFNGRQYHFLRMAYGKDEYFSPEIEFTSPEKANASWYFDETKFLGTQKFMGVADFSSATVIGVTAVLA